MIQPSELALLPEGRVLLLSQIVNVTKTNNIIGFETKTRLEYLQNWVTKQEEIFNK